MTFLKHAAVTLLIVIAIGIAIATSGSIDVAANREHSGVVTWLLETTRESAVERGAGSIDVPALDDEALQLAGINDFEAMCVACHGGPGKSPDAAGKGLNPAAPDLAELAGSRSPAELYWATRNGIRMTGMPAWSASHDDESLWPVVAFISQRLPELDADGYADMLASAGGHGHHGNDAAGADHPHGDEETESTPEEHDHSTHEH